MHNIEDLTDLANELRTDSGIIDSEFIKNIINHDFNIISNENNKKENSINILKYKKKKRNGIEERTIYSILNNVFKDLLKILNTKISEDSSLSDSVHGFRKGRSIKTNANCHLTRKNLTTIDIRNFFTTVTPNMVKKELTKLYPENKMIDEIVSIVTIDDHLPQGYNTSPTIANLILKDMDRELNSLCINNDVIYTRYADDLYFSSNSTLPKINQIEKIIQKHQFEINKDKVKFMKRGQKQFVSGLTIFDDKYARIPKRTKRNLRLEVHKISQHGFKNHAKHLLKKENAINISEEQIDSKVKLVEARIYGWISYLYAIEPSYAIKLSQKLSKADK
jgi:hypothetical protein